MSLTSAAASIIVCTAAHRCESSLGGSLIGVSAVLLMLGFGYIMGATGLLAGHLLDT